MKLSWTYYPKGESKSVTLTVLYLPQLDKFNLPRGGFLTLNNTAYVDWMTYKIFDTGELKARQFAFAELVRIENENGVNIQGEFIRFAKADAELRDDALNGLF